VFVSLLIAAGVQFWRLWRPKLAARTPWGHRPEYLASLAGFVTGSYFLSHAYFWAMFALVSLAAFIGQARHAGLLAPAGGARPALGPRAAGRVARHRGGRVPGTAHGA
jgi:hypothetical protein